MSFEQDRRKLRRKILKALVESNDCILCAVGNYEEDNEIEIEFAVHADPDELFNILLELFKNKVVKDEARKAILYSDYGKTDDSLNIN
jgi:hypothetical protein|tara:strand:+ start:151 stop:414 length:264 start_codon:yes stop_codon:yes gene_type:complete